MLISSSLAGDIVSHWGKRMSLLCLLSTFLNEFPSNLTSREKIQLPFLANYRSFCQGFLEECDSFVEQLVDSWAKTLDIVSVLRGSRFRKNIGRNSSFIYSHTKRMCARCVPVINTFLASTGGKRMTLLHTGLSPMALDPMGKMQPICSVPSFKH